MATDNETNGREDVLSRLERRDKMIDLQAQGWTLQEIGDKFSLSAERVRQIIANTHYTGVWGRPHKERRIIDDENSNSFDPASAESFNDPGR